MDSYDCPRCGNDPEDCDGDCEETGRFPAMTPPRPTTEEGPPVDDHYYGDACYRAEPKEPPVYPHTCIHGIEPCAACAFADGMTHMIERAAALPPEQEEPPVCRVCGETEPGHMQRLHQEVTDARAASGAVPPPPRPTVDQLARAEHSWCVQVEGEFALHHEWANHRAQATYLLARLYSEGSDNT